MEGGENKGYRFRQTNERAQVPTPTVVPLHRGLYSEGEGERTPDASTPPREERAHTSSEEKNQHRENYGEGQMADGRSQVGTHFVLTDERKAGGYSLPLDELERFHSELWTS